MKKNKIYEKVKRIIDIGVSFVGLIVLSPVFLLLILAIKIDSPGPVFFKQKRVGIHKKHFNILKFRTMRIDTPKDMPTHMLKNPEQYITKVGKFLRRTSLDELPQIINILKGNMSIIGPRPALWNQYDLLEERDKYGANDIMPGLTGWAQINGRDELEIPVKAKLDGEYAQKISFAFDVKCFFGTILSVLKSDGVVEGGTGEIKNRKKDLEHEKDKKFPKVLLVANVAKEHVLKFHVPTIKHLSESGWQIDVACSGSESIPYCYRQFVMSYKRSPFNLSLIKGINELRKIVNKGKYDIVYCHTPVGGMAARIASMSARKQGAKVIYFAHGYHFFKGAPLVNWIIYYPIEKLLSLVTDSIILINQEDYQLTKKKFRNCNAYLMNGIGVDEERFIVENKIKARQEYREALGIPQDATVLIYLAELLPNKNQKFLMRCLKKILGVNNNVYLVLAGFDHSNGQFKKYAQELEVEPYIRFLGWREDVAELYNMADICTATSIREGFGLNLVEAMICEIPIVATKNRGHQTIVNDGENGFLVELDNEQQFVDRIMRLIKNKELRNRFIECGIAEKEKYSSDAAVKTIYTILEENIY